MARIVKHEKSVPYVIKEGNFPLYICACGVSKNKPYCDGTHKKTLDEKGELYVYDEKGRAQVKTEY